MPYVRRSFERLIQGQGGSTLIELLVAMPLAVLVLGLVVQGFAVGAKDQQRVEARGQALAHAQRGMDRMMRALRQASWVYFRSSQVVDVETMTRSTAAGTAVRRLVRLDCSTGRCLRLEGPAVGYPPPAMPLFERSEILVGADVTDTSDRIGALERLDVFEPRAIDPATGQARTEYLRPDLVQIRLRIRPEEALGAFELVDGVTLRNRTVSG